MSYGIYLGGAYRRYVITDDEPPRVGEYLKVRDWVDVDDYKGVGDVHVYEVVCVSRNLNDGLTTRYGENTIIDVGDADLDVKLVAIFFAPPKEPEPVEVPSSVAAADPPQVWANEDAAKQKRHWVRKANLYYCVMVLTFIWLVVGLLLMKGCR